MGQVHLRRRPRVSSLLIPAFPAGARGSPQSRVPIHQPNRNRTTNDNHDSQPELIDEQMERFEIDKIRLETQLIEATMRRDRVRLVLDIAKWTVIAAAVVLATIAADHVGLI